MEVVDGCAGVSTSNVFLVAVVDPQKASLTLGGRGTIKGAMERGVTCMKHNRVTVNTSSFYNEQAQLKQH